MQGVSLYNRRYNELNSSVDNTYAPSSSNLSSLTASVGRGRKVGTHVSPPTKGPSNLPPLIGTAASTIRRNSQGNYSKPNQRIVSNTSSNHTHVLPVPSGGVRVQQLYDENNSTVFRPHPNKPSITAINARYGVTNVDNRPVPTHLPPVQESTATFSTRRQQIFSPESAMKMYMHKLTPFEHHEIFNYSKVL